jgi:uncharacterized protein YbaR (Trm112 family)/glycosyltransferase involved in cell wall biosynthesis
MRSPTPDHPVIYQLGNSGFHREAFSWALRRPGLLVLHDVVLHHGRAGELLRSGSGAEYKRLLRARYGPEGAAMAEAVLRGASPENIADFPFSEDYIELASATIVHSRHACELVQRIVPGATVFRVPMGVPLPALVDQADARAMLGLPRDAFVVASITHVNPYKRLPVVIRAMRRLIERLPEAMLVVAGSVSPAVDLERQVRLFSVERNVRLLGYVTDDEARLVARASDVCVNLRYPSAGETSASLLRLLGSGRPVIVTSDAMAAELPADAVIPVEVDRFEDETIAEALDLLARDGALRVTAGAAARAFVEGEHHMGQAVEGYRRAALATWHFELPPVPDLQLFEPEPRVVRLNSPGVSYSHVDAAVADALVHLKVHRHGGTIGSVARAEVDLRLGQSDLPNGTFRKREQDEPLSDTLPIRRELLEILACPVCKTPVRLDGDELVCDACGRRYQIDDGIPIMLVDDDE